MWLEAFASLKLQYTIYETNKGPCTRARKKASKTSYDKKPVATQVKKIKSLALFPLRDSEYNHNLFNTAVLRSRKINTEAWTIRFRVLFTAYRARVQGSQDCTIHTLVLFFPGVMAMTKEASLKINRLCQEKLKSCKNLAEYISSILHDVLEQGSMSWLHISVVGFT